MSAADRRPRALLFDLGRVLVGYDWTASLQRLADRLEEDGHPTSADEIAAWMLGAFGPHDPYCLGRIDDRDLLDAIHVRFDPAMTIEDDWLLEIWCDMFEPWPDALAVIDRLRGQVPLALVSNTNPLHFEHLDRAMRLRERFDHVSTSHEVGAMKPSPAIFRDALEGVGCEAADAWFTDDLEENLEGARALGLHTHRFVSVARLREELESLGFEV
mgnify:FL=1